MLGVNRNIMRKMMCSMKAALAGLGTDPQALLRVAVGDVLYSAEARAVTYGFSGLARPDRRSTDDVRDNFLST